MNPQRRFAPIGGLFKPESVAGLARMRRAGTDWSQDVVHRTRQSLGERICRVVHREDKGRIAQRGDLRHAVGGPGGYGKLAP